MDKEKYTALKDEVQKLFTNDFINELYYPSWVSNPMLVKKKANGKWNTCIDFSNLNDACSKNSYPLPNRSDSGHNVRLRTVVIHGCLFKLQPNSNAWVRPREYNLYDRSKVALL